MEFLQANWLWIVLGLGAVWLVFGRGGMGCAAGGHGAHGTRASGDAERPTHAHGSPNGQGTAESPRREAETAAPRRHGCC